MTNLLALIRDLDTPKSRDRTQPLKSRRQRRQEERVKAGILTQKKIDRLSA